MLRVTALLLAAGAAALAIAGGVASAAKEKPIFDVDCGSAGTFTVVGTPGNGDWTPVRIVGGGMAIPVALSNLHGTFTDNDGNVFEFEDPDIAKNHAPAHKELLDCHFSADFQDENGTAHIDGDAVVYIVGRR